MDEWEGTRRQLLGAAGTAGAAAIAGCERLGSVEESRTDEPSEDESGGGTDLAAVATGTATTIEALRQARIGTTGRLARTETMQSGTDEERSQFLRNEQAELPEDVYRLHYVNLASSNIAASSSESHVGEALNTREAPWQTDELTYGDDGVFVSSAVEALTRSLLSFVAPVEAAAEGRFVLVMQVDLDVLVGTLETPESPRYAQIVDDEGRIVAGTRADEALERNDGMLSVYTEDPDDLSILQDGLAGEDGSVQGAEINDTTVPDHESYTIGFAPVGGVQWVVVVHEPVG